MPQVSARIPIAVALVGRLDDVLVDAFKEIAHTIAAEGPRPLVLDLSDLGAVAGDPFDRIVALLSTLRDAGVEITVESGSSGWRKMLASAGIDSRSADPAVRAAARRRFIIARSGEPAA